LWLLALPLLAVAQTATSGPHDYPTSERVIFVQSCMQEHPGHHYEMLNKCSCAIDKIARQVPFDDYVTMSTATNANSIGGERGGYIREAPALQKQIRQFREIRQQAQKACMIQ
jgi:hypothetical protein